MNQDQLSKVTTEKNKFRVLCFMFVETGWSANTILAHWALIPTGIDQYRCAQSRKPMDMIFQGWSMRLFHA